MGVSWSEGSEPDAGSAVCGDIGRIYASHISRQKLDNCHDTFSQTIADGKAITGDLGGKASTKEYTSAIIEKLA